MANVKRSRVVKAFLAFVKRSFIHHDVAIPWVDGLCLGMIYF